MVLKCAHPAQIEAEEGVGVGLEADLRVGRIGGLGWAGVGASKALRVNADVHGLDGAKSGTDQEGDGHGIEQSRRLLAPLMIEKSERIGERSALAEEEGALDFVELELGGVERHDEEGHAGGEEFLGRGNVIQDVPLGFRGLGWAESDVTVAALDGAAHHNDALEFSEGGRGFVDGGTDVHERTDGNQRDLGGVAADLVKQEGDGIGMRRLGVVTGFRVAALGEGALGRRWRASGYQNVGAADFGEETVEEFGASFGVAESGSEAEDLQFGAAHGQGHGEGVVYVVAYVRVDDDFFRERGSGFASTDRWDGHGRTKQVRNKDR